MRDVSGEFKWRLLPGERLIWTGQPGQGLRLAPSDALMIPFSLMWGGFAVFWEATVLASNAPIIFRMWGIPFVLVGLYLVVGRFFFDARMRRRTYYALTDQRVLIASEGGFGKLTALSLDRLPELQFIGKRDGSGTITFGSAIPWTRGGIAGWPPRGPAVPQFVAIEDAQNVFDRIQRAAQRATPRLT